MVLKFDQKLDNNIPSKTHKNYNQVWKKLTWCVLLCFQGFLELPNAVLVVFLSEACPRPALYYVSDKVGKLDVEFVCNLTRHLRREL